MELQKIYCVDTHAITYRPNDIIQTKYIQKETEKTYVVCERANGTGLCRTIKKSEMKTHYALYALSYEDAITKLKEFVLRQIENNNQRIKSLEVTNKRLEVLLLEIDGGGYEKESNQE